MVLVILALEGSIDKQLVESSRVAAKSSARMVLMILGMGHGELVAALLDVGSAGDAQQAIEEGAADAQSQVLWVSEEFDKARKAGSSIRPSKYIGVGADVGKAKNLVVCDFLEVFGNISGDSDDVRETFFAECLPLGDHGLDGEGLVLFKVAHLCNVVVENVCNLLHVFLFGRAEVAGYFDQVMDGFFFVKVLDNLHLRLWWIWTSNLQTQGSSELSLQTDTFAYHVNTCCRAGRGLCLLRVLRSGNIYKA